MTLEVKLAGLMVRVVDDKPLPPDLDELMAYMARVSNPQGQAEGWAHEKLLRYAIRHRHWSVFEQAEVTLELTTTRDIGRQILRHKVFDFQEFSQRYADVRVLPEAWLRPTRLQDKKNRQNSIPATDEALESWWLNAQEMVRRTVAFVYDGALHRGIAREEARAVLPEGLTTTRLYAKGPMRGWMHYCALRRANGTQSQHAALAAACWNVLRRWAPITCDAFAEAEAREHKAMELLEAWLAEGNKLDLRIAA